MILSKICTNIQRVAIPPGDFAFRFIRIEYTSAGSGTDGWKRPEKSAVLRDRTPVFEYRRAVSTITSQKAEHVGDEENHQNRPQSYTGTATNAPTAMAVVSSTAAKKQQQNNNQYQHAVIPLYLTFKYLFNLADLLLNLTG